MFSIVERDLLTPFIANFDDLLNRNASQRDKYLIEAHELLTGFMFLRSLYKDCGMYRDRVGDKIISRDFLGYTFQPRISTAFRNPHRDIPI